MWKKVAAFHAIREDFPIIMQYKLYIFFIFLTVVPKIEFFFPPIFGIS